VVVNKFFIDYRYNHIGFTEVSTWRQIIEIEAWCDAMGNYKVLGTGIVYETEQDLSAFLLRWA
jgi:hypothetical protein